MIPGESAKYRPPAREAHIDELNTILDRTKSGPLADEDRAKLVAAVTTLAILQKELLAKNASIRHLKELFFGSGTEKTSDVLDEQRKNSSETDESSTSATGSEDPASESTSEESREKKKRRGHGRNGAAAYTGANRIKVSHATLKHGDACPNGDNGKVYVQLTASPLLRITGTAPIIADLYECECLRCNVCGEVFKAAAPSEAGKEKYDESVAAMIALLKYGAGVPFHRLEQLQAGWGVPLPAGTQWELVEEAANQAEPAFKELIRQAAQAEVLHNDDTTMKILEVNRIPPVEEEIAPKKGKKRTGTFTSGIIARSKTGVAEEKSPTMALFFTGRKHAGENLADVLAQREENLSKPIHMCDALSRNAPGEFERLLANCIPHGRRKFVNIVENFPEECRFVLETLRDVYRNEAISEEKGYTPDERLRFHQAESGPLMEKLREWFHAQVEEQKVEPNSGLGEAIDYMRDHWPALTLFLRVAGAPLDNNICERSLKKAILNRKNAYFFKTENGARVGDIFMSLIHTSQLNDENPFQYLLALQRHATHVKEEPSDWMPWNYRNALKPLSTGADPPS